MPGLLRSQRRNNFRRARGWAARHVERGKRVPLTRESRVRGFGAWNPGWRSPALRGRLPRATIRNPFRILSLHTHGIWRKSFVCCLDLLTQRVEVCGIGHMKLKPNPAIAVVIAAIHFGIGFITSIAAAGQADSLGQPHGYGWIILSDIFTFPLTPIWDALDNHFHFSDGSVVTAMLIQSVCWGVVISLFFPSGGKSPKPN